MIGALKFEVDKVITSDDFFCNFFVILMIFCNISVIITDVL